MGEEGHDIVAYDDGDGDTGPCKKDGWSSNFMGARKGNPVSRIWWENVKHKMTRLCGPGEFMMEKVCCHEVGGPKPDRRKCHIPWAHLEWLKQPHKDPDAKEGGFKLDPTKKHTGVAAALPKGEFMMEKVCCHEVYWQPWTAASQSTNMDAKGRDFDMRFNCRYMDGQDELDCKHGNWGDNQRVIPKFFGRIAYHMFFSTRKPYVKSESAVLSGDWLASEMYRRSLAKLGTKDAMK